MPKVGINVGEDFPAEEVNQHGSDSGETCAEHEAWHHLHDEWHRRARAFGDDMHRAAHRHFGTHDFTLHNMFVLRAVLAAALFVLVIALLPHMFILGVLLAVAAFVFFRRHRFHHHHGYSDASRGDVNI